MHASAGTSARHVVLGGFRHLSVDLGSGLYVGSLPASRITRVSAALASASRLGGAVVYRASRPRRARSCAVHRHGQCVVVRRAGVVGGVIASSLGVAPSTKPHGQQQRRGRVAVETMRGYMLDACSAS